MTDKLGSFLRDHWLIVASLLGAAVAWGASTTQIAYLGRGQEAMVTRIDARFDVLTSKIDGLSGNVTQAQTRVEDMRNEFDRLERRVYAVESKH